MKEVQKFIAEIEYVAEINGDNVSDDIAADIESNLERNQDGCYSCADLDVTFSQVLSVTETTNMKTTFTLQDILSIKKDTWINFIKSKMNSDQIKLMEECNYHWHNLAFEGHQEIDKYRIFTGDFFEYADGEKSSKTIFLSFYKDLLFIDVTGLSDGFCEYYAKRMEECSEAGLLELMKIITQLVIVLYNLDVGDPSDVGNKVTFMINDLINNQTQGK